MTAEEGEGEPTSVRYNNLLKCATILFGAQQVAVKFLGQAELQKKFDRTKSHRNRRNFLFAQNCDTFCFKWRRSRHNYFECLSGVYLSPGGFINFECCSVISAADVSGGGKDKEEKKSKKESGGNKESKTSSKAVSDQSKTIYRRSF